jgi:hypothetical protein
MAAVQRVHGPDVNVLYPPREDGVFKVVVGDYKERLPTLSNDDERRALVIATYTLSEMQSLVDKLDDRERRAAERRAAKLLADRARSLRLDENPWRRREGAHLSRLAARLVARTARSAPRARAGTPCARPADRRPRGRQARRHRSTTGGRDDGGGGDPEPDPHGLTPARERAARVVRGVCTPDRSGRVAVSAGGAW